MGICILDQKVRVGSVYIVQRPQSLTYTRATKDQIASVQQCISIEMVAKLNAYLINA